MSSYRVRAHTVAGGFSALLGMVPLKVLHHAGYDESVAASIAAACLSVLAVSAVLLRNTAWVRSRSYSLAVFGGEVFSMQSYLTAFAAYALVMAMVFVMPFIALATM